MEADAFLTEELMEESPEETVQKPGRGAVEMVDADGYKYTGHREPAWKVSDILRDEEGKRYQMWSVGMVRNASPENRKEERVYLDPIPHVVKSQNIPLRGWYKSKFEPKGVRARPCCLLPDTLVDTPWGPKPIKDLKVGDIVCGYNENKGDFSQVQVQAVFHQTRSEYMEATLGNGKTLKLTHDHQVFTKKRGWVEAGELITGIDILSIDGQGVPFTNVQTVVKETPVCDIQTSTRNFFAEGVLVHNSSDAILTSPYSGSCSVNCGFCLAPESPVDTPNGPCRIDRLSVGDSVLGSDEGQEAESKVTAVVSRQVSHYYRLQTTQANFRITGEHPVDVVNKGWTPVDQLMIGDRIKTSNGHAIALELTLVNDPLTVWDIQTTTENFYCQGHLLHNCYVEYGHRGWRASGITVVDPEYPDKVRKQVSKMRTATALYLSSFIDPFLELEPIYQNSRRTAQVAVDNGLPIFFLTRKVAPDWVFDCLRENKYSYMQFSINTPDPEDWIRLSPRAAPLTTQYDQIRAMHKKGIYVSIQVNPIIAGVTSNDQICQLIHELAAVGADHLIFKFVEISYSSRTAMVERIKDRFTRAKDPHRDLYDYDRGDMFASLFTQAIGGEYTIDEDYRKSALDRFSIECKKAGVTMALCYEYEYARRPDGSIIDKTGVSMGHKYLTADQCHGHRVPVFTRNGPDDLWKEIKGCPPSGCLTCQDDSKDETPCHNDYLASAPAWKPADMNKPALLPAGSQQRTKDGRLQLVVLKDKGYQGKISLDVLGGGDKKSGGCGSSCGG